MIEDGYIPSFFYYPQSYNENIYVETHIMKDLKDNCELALIQALPFLFDSLASTKKAIRFI